MRFFSRTPLAWLNLAHRPMRFLLFLAGIGFAVLLMFVQLGFWCALLDSVVAVIDHMNADLVIVNRAKYALDTIEPFPRRRLAEVWNVEGVASVTPLYVRQAMLKTPPNEQGESSLPSQHLIRVLAYEPSSGAMTFPEVAQDAQRLKRPRSALRDSLSKPVYHMPQGNYDTELNDRRIRLVGMFSLGPDFGFGGNLIMSEQNYVLYFTGLTYSASPLEDVDVGLVKVKDGVDPQTVLKALQAELPPDVCVFTREEYATTETEFWTKTTPVGMIFSLGMAVGFLVGIVICSQILSTDVADHLGEYATLKAIGYTNSFLTSVVLKEALLLSVLGFLPGLGFSAILYWILEWQTGLPMHLTIWRGTIVLSLTVLMSVISAFLALRKVWVTDPAEVFG